MGLIAEEARARGAGPAPTAPTAFAGLPGLAPPQTKPGGVLGFFSNFLGEGADIVKGLSSLAGAGIMDIGHGFRELATLGKAEGGFRTDDIAKALPGAIWEDLKTRYGPLLRGDISEFGQQLYERPLSFGLDALGVGSLAGRGAKALSAASPAVRAGVQAVRAGEEAGPLARVTSAILPKTEARLGPLGEVQQVTGHYNPVRRAMIDRPYRRLATETTEALEQEAGALGAVVAAGTALPWQKARAAELSTLVEKIRAAGIGRIDKPFVADWKLRRITDKVKGDLDSGWLRRRAEDMTAFRNALRGISSEDAEQAAVALQRLDFNLAPQPTAAPAGGGAVATVAAPTRAPVSRALAEATERLRSEVDIRWTQPQIERGLLTPEQAIDRAYLPLRIKHGAKYNPDALDPVTGTKGMWEGGPSTAELRAGVQAAGLPEPIYFPHIDARRVKFSDFLRSMKLVGGRRAARPGYQKLNTGYLLEKGLYIKDPVEAYTRRAALAVRHEETVAFFDKILGTFGRPIKTLDEVGPHEALVAPDGIHAFFRARLKLADELQELLSDGMDVDDALAKALSTAVTSSQDEIARMLVKGAPHLGVGRGKLYAVPKVVADRLEAHVKPLLGMSARAEKFARLFYDTPMNTWRGLVLAGSPRWIANNLFGNVFFAKMQGARVRDAVAILEKRLLKTVNDRFGTSFDVSLLDELARIPGAEEARGGMFRMEEQYAPRLGTAGESAAGQLYKAIGGAKPVRGARRVGQFMRTVNSELEDAFRQASFMKAAERQVAAQNVRQTARSFWSSKRRLERIGEHGLTDEQAKAALAEVNRFFNDYTRLGPWERKLIKRFLIPFYSFYKHSAKLLITFPFDYPEKAALMARLAEVSKEMGEEVGPVPEWLEGALPMGQEGEDTRFLMTRGANPFSGLLEHPLAQLAPPIQVAMEQRLGRDVFTGRQFSDERTVTPFGSEQPYRITTDDQGNPIGAEPVEKVAPGILNHLLQQIPQYELAKSLWAGGATYDTASLLEILRGRGVMTDPATGEPRYPVSMAQKLGGFAGFPTIDYGLGRFQERLSEEQAAAIKMYLRRIGTLPPAP
jgi:hypothetical protein